MMIRRRFFQILPGLAALPFARLAKAKAPALPTAENFRDVAEGLNSISLTLKIKVDSGADSGAARESAKRIAAAMKSSVRQNNRPRGLTQD
jgi:hypothetical protein